MQNGITRLYNAIWYTQVGRALEQKVLEIENTENDYDSLPDDFESKQENNRHNIQRKSISDNTEFWRDFNSQRNTSGIVVQKVLIENIEAVRGVYEDIIRGKQENIQRYKQAIGHLIALIEQKKNSLKGLAGGIEKLEKVKKAAIAKSKNVSSELKLSGLSDREIKQHQDYTRCLNTYHDYDSTVNEKKVRIDKLEHEIARAQQDIEHHKSNITQLHRDMEKIKTEQSEAIADLITAREKEEINGILSDIRVDRLTHFS